MRRVTKKWKTMLTGIAIGVMALSLNVSAQTRSYLFHMNEDYLHGTVANCGYVATKLISFCKQEAKNRDFDRLELDVWEFNEGAIKFYDSVGFKTYREYKEMNI